MHSQVITKKANQLLFTLGDKKITKNFYQGGGTALALQYGHRKSKDFDFFSKKDFSTKKIKEQIHQLGRIKVLTEEEGTLNIELNSFRISFFKYKYRLLFPLIKYEKIYLADPLDIACMKINAIASRGSKKDFIDFYFLLKNYSLKKLLSLFIKKYRGAEYSRLHILKSLVYFREADKEPMPLMIKKVKWATVKKELQNKIKNYLLA